MSYYVKGKGWFESSGRYMGSKRSMALGLAKTFGYHNDTRGFTRLVIEARVNRRLLQEQFDIGRKLALSQQKLVA